MECVIQENIVKYIVSTTTKCRHFTITTIYKPQISRHSHNIIPIYNTLLDCELYVSGFCVNR